MTLLAIGDSFTFGAELPDVPRHLGYYGNDYCSETTRFETINVAPSQYAWPNLLAKKLGTAVVNLGLVGGSNDRVFRLAVKETIRKKYDLVVCAWTGIDRLDLTLHGKELPLTIGSADQWRHVFPWVTEFIANHYDSDFAAEKWLSQVIALQAYFTSIDQPYVFVKSMPTSVQPSNDVLNKKVNLKNCIDWDSSMIQWCKDKGCRIGDGGHFLEEGHELVAEKIFKFLQEKK